MNIFGPYAINKVQNVVFLGRLQRHVCGRTPVTAGTELMGVIGLSSMHFWLPHPAQQQEKINRRKSQHEKHTSVHICRPCAPKSVQHGLMLGLPQRACV